MIANLLGVALLTVHLLAMNLASGGPLVAALLDIFAGSEPERTRHTLRSLLIRALQAALVGVALGLVMLGIAYARSDFEKFNPVQSNRWVIVLAEFLVGVGCTSAAAATWHAANRWVPRLLALAAATNLLYHFPFFFSSLSVIPQRAEWIGMPYEAPLRALLMRDPEIWARSLHVILASLAVSAWTAALIAARSDAYASPMVQRRGALLCLICTAVQFLSGVWLLFEITSPARNRLLGEHWGGTAALVAAILLAFVMMHHLALVALGDLSASKLARVGLMLGGIVLLMTAILQLRS